MLCCYCSFIINHYEYLIQHYKVYILIFFSSKFQVSEKQSELGIGQPHLVANYANLVDYLPPMYIFELFFASKKPGELATFDSIVIPFDKYVWAFMFGCICAQFLLLVLMQQLYSIVADTRNSIDFIYEGNLQKMSGLKDIIHSS